MTQEQDMEGQQVVVSMTGFVNDPDEDEYKKMIAGLGLRLAPTLSEQTKYLIVKDVTTEKYKIAKLYSSRISTVTVEWLIHSHRQQEYLPPQRYLVRQLFYGAGIGVLGEGGEQIGKRIEEFGGKVLVMKKSRELIRAIEEESFNFSVVVLMAETKEEEWGELAIPVVTQEWLEDSFKAGYCKWPIDYALNLPQVVPKQTMGHYRKMRAKLEAKLQEEPNSQPSILEDTVIYIAQNIHQDMIELLKRLVMVEGGFWIEKLSGVATHILTETPSQQELSQFRINGSLTQVVRVAWLIDSVYLHKRLPERDYYIRCCRSSNTPLTSQNSAASRSLGSMPNRMSISAYQQPKTTTVAIQKTAPKHQKYQNTLFKDWRFYIDSSQKKQAELSELPSRIQKNGGIVYASRANIAEGHVLYVLKDSLDCQRMIDQLKKDVKGRAQIQPISHRWVTECLSKGHFIDFSRSHSFVYKPFNFKTPIMGFHKMIFDVLGVDDSLKARLKELYNALGSGKNAPNRSELTHVLCGDKYTLAARFKQIRKDNHTVEYLRYEWLQECAARGEIVAQDAYILNPSDISAHKQNVLKNGQQLLPF